MYVYIIISFFVFLDVLAIIICLTLMDHLGTETRFHSFGNIVQIYLRKPIVATLKMFVDWKIYIIIPMMILDVILSSFVLEILPRLMFLDRHFDSILTLHI